MFAYFFAIFPWFFRYQLGLHDKPIGLLNVANYWGSLIEWVCEKDSSLNQIDVTHVSFKINKWICWRLMCKKEVYRFWGQCSFLAGLSWFLADWLVWAWKGWLFCNCFCWSALRFREIMHMQKNSDFLAESLGANLTKMDVDVTWMWTVSSSSFNST